MTELTALIALYLGVGGYVAYRTDPEGPVAEQIGAALIWPVIVCVLGIMATWEDE
jgi:hypothetical protein